MTFLLVNAGVIAALALFTWGIAVRIRDPSFIDTCWGLGFVVIAWATLVQTEDRGARAWLLTILTTLWGVRLGAYLFWRWRKHGIDARYAAMLKKAKSPARYMLTNVFLMQAALMLVVALPVELGQRYSQKIGPLAVQGVLLVLLGYAFEWTGDFQLTRFKSDPANKGKVMDRGLWRFTRHPNYFGDFCVWWGLFLIGGQPVTIVGPLVMSVLLMRVSGVGLLERQLHKTKPQYADYVKRTSAFFPMPPR